MKRAFTPSSTGVTLYFIRGPCRCNNGRCVQLRSILEPAGTNRSIPRNYLCAFEEVLAGRVGPGGRSRKPTLFVSGFVGRRTDAHPRALISHAN
jgi:hypothetical protein